MSSLLFIYISYICLKEGLYPVIVMLLLVSSNSSLKFFLKFLPEIFVFLGCAFSSLPGNFPYLFWHPFCFLLFLDLWQSLLTPILDNPFDFMPQALCFSRKLRASKQVLMFSLEIVGIRSRPYCRNWLSYTWVERVGHNSLLAISFFW